jgi:predicted RNase H-like HicB family nuclease
MVKRYTGVITKEDKWYVATCLELGVVSQGKTVEEAQRNLQEAVDLYIESFGADGVPEGSTAALMYQIEVKSGF